MKKQPKSTPCTRVPKSKQDKNDKEDKNGKNTEALRTLMTSEDWSMEEGEEEVEVVPDEEVQPEPEVVTRKRKPPVPEFEVELEKPGKKIANPSNMEPDKTGDMTTADGAIKANGDLKDDKKVDPPKDVKKDTVVAGATNDKDGKKNDDKDKEGEMEKIDTTGKELEEKNKNEENEKKQDPTSDGKESQFHDSQNTQWFLDCTYVCIYLFYLVVSHLIYNHIYVCIYI